MAIQSSIVKVPAATLEGTFWHKAVTSLAIPPFSYHLLLTEALALLIGDAGTRMLAMLLKNLQEV